MSFPEEPDIAIVNLTIRKQHNSDILILHLQINNKYVCLC